MGHLIALLLAMSGLCVLTGAVPQEKPAGVAPFRILPGRAPEIDGRILDDEWSDALEVKVTDSCSLRLKHDKSAVYLSYAKFPQEGFACLFVKCGDDVKLLHASAQLGSAMYVKKDASWNPKSKDYVWRKADAMWKEEGWKATVMAPAGQEFAVSFKTLGIEGDSEATLGFGYVYFEKGSPKTISWPDTKDACGDSKLLSGWNPAGLKFDFSKWAVIKPVDK